MRFAVGQLCRTCWLAWILSGASLAALLSTWAFAQMEPQPRTGAPLEAGESADGEKQYLIREGTEIVDQLGYFKITGDRATFDTLDGKRQFVGLENLNLARIVNTLSNWDGPDLQWSIDGTITEYRGANYVLVKRAVRKTRSDQPLTNPLGRGRSEPFGD